MNNPPTAAEELASLAVNAGRALKDEKRHYQIACQENARLRAVVARLRQMADYWEQQLPEVIRTPAVVSAIRAALEAADDPSRLPAGSEDTTTTRADTLAEAIAAVEDPEERAKTTTGLGLGWEAARDVLRRLAAETQPTEAEAEWCKCRSCWGWFVEEHPGEDLDELGRDLGWWSGLPVHRDAPAASAGVQTDEEPLLCPRCGTDISEYGEDDFVFRTGDERPYCSGECIVAAHRADLKAQQDEDPS